MDYKNRNWLQQKYSIEELNTYQIAKLCGCGQTTIRRWLKKLNIQTRSYSKAFHLARANHCNLSDEAKQWIDGELLGDGCLRSHSKYSANIEYCSKHLEYINYVSQTLISFGIKQCGKIHKIKDKKSNCYAYHYGSLFYDELLPIRKRWYPKNKKIIPRDLKLTPLILRQEHIGDGSLIHRRKGDGNPYIALYTCGFSIKDVEQLIKQLIMLGFKATRQSNDNTIHISTKSTKQFLDYIGSSPVRCYNYKFAY